MNKSYNKDINILMLTKRMTASRLSKIIGCAYDTAYRKLQGDRQYTLEDVVKLAEYYDFDLNVLLKGN